MSLNQSPISCIVIPCYNEGNRLPVLEYENFLSQNPNILLCFVDDGSTDNTKDLIDNLKSGFKSQVDLISYQKNQGKAEAVRHGINYCNSKYDHEKIAYLDADLATSLEECQRLSSFIDSEITFVFGSRILKIGSKIERKKYRFLIGRVIATLISNILKLKIYDTQCGCKIFTKELSIKLFKDPFISKWLFDVELFKRFILIHGLENAQHKMCEIPLKKWIDMGESKVSMTYFFRMWWDLLLISRSYNASKLSVIEGSKIIDETK